jgi:putative tryptophan/tyrosine transport system substrate-binding protein
MRRRELIAGIGSVAAWPALVRAQEITMPVIGYMGAYENSLVQQNIGFAFRGLADTGYVVGRNATIEYGGRQDDPLPARAADLVRRKVDVIFSFSAPPVLAAKAATSTIPIVFSIGVDPVKMGLVASLNHPGGNVTGVINFSAEIITKRLELVHELVPTATLIAVLANLTNPAVVEGEMKELRPAADRLGVRLLLLSASESSEIEGAFATLVQERASALLIGSDPQLYFKSDQIIELAARHRVPAVYGFRENATAGGLMSYSGLYSKGYYTVGAYIGRILKGEKPADLPVQRASGFELVINLKTAKALGVAIPETLLATADEVIEGGAGGSECEMALRSWSTLRRRSSIR